MKSVYDAATLLELTDRINQLTPESPRQWGTMDVAQMMAHCSYVLEVTLGERPLKANLMGKIFGRLVKSVLVNDKAFKHDMPTHPSYVMKSHKNFNEEKPRLIASLARMSVGGPRAMENRKHPIFGPLTPEEWSISTYKHLDHHLRQFGA